MKQDLHDNPENHVILSKTYSEKGAQSVVWHERHSERRRAFRVPHAEQRMYITRVNHPVMNALTPRINIRTAAFNRKSFTQLLWTGD